MSVRYGTVSVLYRILRVGIGIIPIPYRTDTENAKKWIPIGIPIGIEIGTGSVRDRYRIGIRWHMLIPTLNCADTKTLSQNHRSKDLQTHT
ncbi:hypothetical protein Hanom_Chr12g01110761 [Helianthus anomalus]